MLNSPFSKYDESNYPLICDELLISEIRMTQDGQHYFKAEWSMEMCFVGLYKETKFCEDYFGIYLGNGHYVGSMFLSSAFHKLYEIRKSVNTLLYIIYTLLFSWLG